MTRLLTGAALVVIASVASSVGVQAATSIPSPRWFWDSNGDYLPDASAYTIRTAGVDSNWTSGREARITAAVNEWRTTQWNPSVNLTAAPADCYESLSCHGVWIDGSAGCLGTWPAGVLAVNCTYAQLRTEPSPDFYDLGDADVFFHTAGTAHPIWTYSAAGSSEDDVWDFQGSLTHEMGHSILLIDLGVSGAPACAPGGTLETMCGYVYKGWQTTQQRSLVPDDETSANTVY